MRIQLCLIDSFKHDVATFGLMISRLVSANQLKQAEDLLDRMKKESCKTKKIYCSLFVGAMDVLIAG